MIDRAVATGLPRRDKRMCHAASTADEQPGQGRGNPRVAPSDHAAAAATGPERPQFHRSGRALLAALLHQLPLNVLRRLLRLLVRPDTALRWHRDPLARRHAVWSRPKRPGRPRTVRSIRTVVLRLARENPSWGYRRLPGELLVLGIKVAASTVWEMLKQARIGPAPERAASTWAEFLRSQAEALLACDFLETLTLTGARLSVLAVIEHANRRVRVMGATAHPTATWVAHAANLVMDLQNAGSRARLLIRDRDGKFPALFDAVVHDEGIDVVLSGIRMPRMNSIMERWAQTCRRELLDRTLIWNQQHLLHAPREFEQFYNGHRPHQGIANARPSYPLPAQVADPHKLAHLDNASTYEGATASAAFSTSTSVRRNLRGRGSRQVHRRGQPPQAHRPAPQTHWQPRPAQQPHPPTAEINNSLQADLQKLVGGFRLRGAGELKYDSTSLYRPEIVQA